MPHLAPINWLIVWFLIWSSFFLLAIVIWWKFKTHYVAPSLSTKETSTLGFWSW
nr:TPA_asm: ATP synthase F0 subunit 8 [Peltospira operculata]